MNTPEEKYCVDFERSMEQYSDMIYRIALTITGNEEDAKDVFQETFLRLVRYQHRITGEEHLITTRSGGTISLQHTASLYLPEMAGDNWSYIREYKIYVTVLKTEKIRYQAAFEIEGEAYELTGIDVTQKEFIDYLYKFLSK